MHAVSTCCGLATGCGADVALQLQPANRLLPQGLADWRAWVNHWLVLHIPSAHRGAYKPVGSMRVAAAPAHLTPLHAHVYLKSLP